VNSSKITNKLKLPNLCLFFSVPYRIPELKIYITFKII
jgi:hypothetical protein